MISENTEEAWLKLFMLPKCVLPSTKRGGCHKKLQPIDFLCNLWANNDLTCLWNLAKGRANKLRYAPAKNQNTPGKPVDKWLYPSADAECWGKLAGPCCLVALHL